MEQQTIKILQNDAYHALSIQTGIAYRTLEKRIFNRMIAEGILEGYNTTDVAGKSVYDVFKSCGLEFYEMTDMLFKDYKGVKQLTEILKEIYFWGINGECPDCGCEVKVVDTDWNDKGKLINLKECVNCSFTDSGVVD